MDTVYKQSKAQGACRLRCTHTILGSEETIVNQLHAVSPLQIDAHQNRKVIVFEAKDNLDYYKSYS